MAERKDFQNEENWLAYRKITENLKSLIDNEIVWNADFEYQENGDIESVKIDFTPKNCLSAKIS